MNLAISYMYAIAKADVIFVTLVAIRKKTKRAKVGGEISRHHDTCGITDKALSNAYLSVVLHIYPSFSYNYLRQRGLGIMSEFQNVISCTVTMQQQR